MMNQSDGMQYEIKLRTEEKKQKYQCKGKMDASDITSADFIQNHFF